MSELCSIVMPAYNAERFITDSIQSVLAQTYKNWELVVINDKSDDRTVEIVNDLKRRDGRIKLYHLEKNSGAAVSRNAAINAAAGRFIAFLDSDDLWEATKLEKQVGFMLQEDCPFSYTAYRKIDEDGKLAGAIIEAPRFVDYTMMLRTDSIGCLTAMYDAKRLGKQFLPVLPKKEEYVLWLKILKIVRYARGLTECLAYRRIRKNSHGSNKLEAVIHQWKVYREVEKVPLVKSAYFFANYAYHGFVKTIR